MIAKALTIAGSDSGGGAGVQADLKTFSALRVYGMSVITSLTAQNTTGVAGVFDVSPEFVAQQFDAVMTDLPADAAKTGMLSHTGLVEVVAQKIREYKIEKLVVDPVMISKAGSPLLRPEAVDAMRQLLLPLALVITPNIEEAAALAGGIIRTADDMKEAAKVIHAMGPRSVLVKGGHLEGDAADIFFDGKEFSVLRAERISTKDSHGTGCVLSAAIAANLAKGERLLDAVCQGKQFVTEAIRNALRIGGGCGPCDPLGLER